MSDDFKDISWPGWETARLIGRGSFGAVYEIERKVFDETEKAALKVISIPQNSGDIDDMYSDGYDEESITSTFKSHLQSIVAEYSLMRKMNGSANIVNCDDVRYIQHDDGIGWDIFIKMELLTPLTKALSGNVDEETVIKIAKDMCGALELCKKHGIVHRDIKPQNIFVSEHGDYKLGDFGIAKTVEKTMGGTKIGTYKYMAPEVYNNQPYGSGADIYSLGLVLYWLLNERRMPFMPLPPEKLKAGVEESSRNRRLSGEELPEPAHGSKRLKQIVLKACAYDPKERYQSATEMLQDIDNLFGIPVKPEPPKPVPPAPPEPKPEPPVPPMPPQPENKKKSKLPLILGIVAVGIVVIILLLLRSCDSGKPNDDHPQGTSTTNTTQVVSGQDMSISSISIKTNPSKGSYYVGETLDTSDLTLIATYNDGTTKTITSGFVCTPNTLSNAGTQTITVNYEGKQATLTVNVSAVPVSGISVKTKPSKTSYFVGEDLNLSGLVLLVTYENGDSEDIAEGYECVFSSFQKVGEHEITVTYGGQSASFVVNVTETTVNNITVKSNPNKTSYFVGDTLDTNGLSLMATYNNGTTKTISSGFTCSPTTLGTAGTQTVTVYYEGKKATFTVNVTAVSVSSISVKTKPNKTSYYVGDTLNTNGLTLTATYNNGTTKTISSVFSCSPTTLSTAGTQTITVNYEGKKTTFSVSVEAVYTASWNTGTGYSITVRRTSSSNANAPTGTLSSGAEIYRGDVLSISYAASTGYTLTGQGSTSITVTGNVTSSNIYASAKVNSYIASWSVGTGYSITVKRTSSSLAGASISTLSSGNAVYYGDVLSITYTASTGYTITSHGRTSITVTGNVTSSNIYASAKANSYTYNVVYVSSNGTSLGSSTVTYNYGTTNTVSAPAKSGYTTPSSQSVKWDSTSAKTITFTYTPEQVTNSVKTGNFLNSSPKITYSTTINYRNRTATSIQVQFTTTVKMQNGWSGFQHGVAYKASCGSVNSGVVQVAKYYALQNAGASSTASSGWITFSLNTANATTVSFNVYMYQNNLNGTDLTSYGYSNNSFTWTVNIPAY